MSDINQAAEDLFFKLRNRFPKIKLGDEDGKPTIDPAKGRFFNFPYTDKDSNRNYGDISCSLIDGNSLKVFFDTAITERMLPEDKNYWYQFLRELRRMAKSHMLNFDVRDITKDTLSRRDYEYMIKLNPEKKKMKESLEESRVLWQRRGKFSEGTLNNVRINVVHNEKMLENPNNRLLKVDRIYLVNENGEKFLLPFKSVGGAKAMANHVSRGGNPYDSHGQIISRAISEMKNLSRFTSVTRNRTFESAEAGDVITAAQQMKESIKRHVTRLTHNSRSFSESLEALSTLLGENNEDVTEVKGWFTQQTYNENLDNYLASAAGAYKKLKEGVFIVQEAAGDVEKKILDPNFKLVLKSDPGLDKLMVSRQYTNTTALLTAVLGDIANRMMAKDGDDIANFASLMGDLVSSEGESFGQKSEPEYNRDKKLAIMLAQKYMKDLAEIRKNPEYEKQVRKTANRDFSAKESIRTEADQFAEEIMNIGEEEVEESGLQYYTGKKKYGKDGMEALAKAGRDGASQEELGRVKDKYMKKEDAVNEEPNEGNEFSGNLAKAKAAGKKEFKVDGKTYPVKEGDASEPEHKKADADDKRYDDEEDYYDADGSTNPHGAYDAGGHYYPERDMKETKETPMKNKNIEEMRRLAGLPLMENYIYAQEEDKSEDEENAPDTVPHKADEPSADDKAEYDQEGRMAKSDLKTAKDAADELRSILDDDENLPEWVQAKITKAVDYLDTARDYMKDNDVEYTDETVEEAKSKGKPDYLDFDKDGDKEESMKKALSDKKKMKESADLTWLQAIAGINRK